MKNTPYALEIWSNTTKRWQNTRCRTSTVKDSCILTNLTTSITVTDLSPGRTYFVRFTSSPQWRSEVSQAMKTKKLGNYTFWLYGKARQIGVLGLVLYRSGFAVRIVSTELVPTVYFWVGTKPANSKFAIKTAQKREYYHSSERNYQKKFKKIELKFYRDSENGWRRRNILRNLLTELARDSSRTGEYWHEVIAVRTERSVSKRLIFRAQFFKTRLS